MAPPMGFQRDTRIVGKFDKDEISRTKGTQGKTLGLLSPYFREDLLKLG
jgi:hypothetical protein